MDQGRPRSGDTVGIAPDVSGLVSEVLVHDNDSVRKGDVLFRIDRYCFCLALRQAEANLEGRAAALDMAEPARWRYRAMSKISNSDQKSQSKRPMPRRWRRSTGPRPTATAKRNLERSEVRGFRQWAHHEFRLAARRLCH